jgi:hypothetical protein
MQFTKGEQIMAYKCVAAASMVALLSGCGGVYVVDTLYSAPVLDQDLITSGKLQVNVAGKAFQERLKKAAGDDGERNTLVHDVKRVSDEICRQHIGDIRATATNFNLTFGTLTTVFAGTATLVGGAAAKSHAAIAGASNASRSLVNEEVYRQSLPDAIVNIIRNERDKARQRIDTGLRKTRAEYPINEALSDVQEYHDACSFVFAMGKVVEAAAEKSRKETLVELTSRHEALIGRIQKMRSALSNLPGDAKAKAESAIASAVEDLSALTKALSTAPR